MDEKLQWEQKKLLEIGRDMVLCLIEVNQYFDHNNIKPSNFIFVNGVLKIQDILIPNIYLQETISTESMIYFSPEKRTK